MEFEYDFEESLNLLNILLRNFHIYKEKAESMKRKNMTHMYMSTAPYIIFEEHNEHEGETWRFYIKYQGNEQQIGYLRGDLKRLHEEYHDEDYTIFDKCIPEYKVDVLNELDEEGYMAKHNKIDGKLDYVRIMQEKIESYVVETEIMFHLLNIEDSIIQNLSGGSIKENLNNEELKVFLMKASKFNEDKGYIGIIYNGNEKEIRAFEADVKKYLFGGSYKFEFDYNKPLTIEQFNQLGSEIQEKNKSRDYRNQLKIRLIDKFIYSEFKNHLIKNNRLEYVSRHLYKGRIVDFIV